MTGPANSKLFLSWTVDTPVIVPPVAFILAVPLTILVVPDIIMPF